MASRLRQYVAIQLVPSACSSRPPDGSPDDRSNAPMLSRPRKPPSKMLLPSRVLAVHPPREIDQQLLERALEERAVAPAVDLPLDLVDADRGPRVHRRVHVAERPLVGGDLPVRMHVPLAHQQQQLVLGEIRVDHRERDDVERRVPRREPRVLPLVRHRQDVARGEVRPVMIAAVPARVGRRRSGRIAVEPAVHRIVVVLLRPQHPGEGLPLHVAHVLRQLERRHAPVELVGLAPAQFERRVEPGAERVRRWPEALGEPQSDLRRFARRRPCAGRAARPSCRCAPDSRHRRRRGPRSDRTRPSRRPTCRASRDAAPCSSRSRRRAPRPAPRCRARTPRLRGTSP